MPIKHDDVPIKHYDCPIKHDDFSIQSDDVLTHPLPISPPVRGLRMSPSDEARETHITELHVALPWAPTGPMVPWATYGPLKKGVPSMN